MNVAERQAVRNAQPTPTPVTPAPVVQPEQPTPVQKVDPTP